MRFLLDVIIPNDPFNRLVSEGKVAATMEKVMGAVKPEAIYFTERQGKRGCTAIVNISNPSQIPTIAEPFFLAFNAEVHFHCIMSPEELGASNIEQFKGW